MIRLASVFDGKIDRAVRTLADLPLKLHASTLLLQYLFTHPFSSLCRERSIIQVDTDVRLMYAPNIGTV